MPILRAFWAGWLRPGGKPGADEVVPFLAHCAAMMPGAVRAFRVRGDAGFYSDDTLTWLESASGVSTPIARRSNC